MINTIGFESLLTNERLPLKNYFAINKRRNIIFIFFELLAWG